MDPNLFYLRVWIWMYLKGYDLENSKNMFLQHFDNLQPWKQSRWPPNNYLKSLKLQSHCVQINFLFTVGTNITLSSLLLWILWLLCFSFILLYYLHFMLTNNISNRHKTYKYIAIYKSLGKSKDQYIYKQTLPLLRAEP